MGASSSQRKRLHYIIWQLSAMIYHQHVWHANTHTCIQARGAHVTTKSREISASYYNQCWNLYTNCLTSAHKTDIGRTSGWKRELTGKIWGDKEKKHTSNIKVNTYIRRFECYGIWNDRMIEWYPKLMSEMALGS